MKHLAEVRYPVSSECLLRTFTDLDFHINRVKALRLPFFEVLEHSVDDREFMVKIRRAEALEVPVPGALKKVLPTQIMAINEDRWDATKRQGRSRVELAGVPVDITCSMTVVNDQSGCLLKYVFDLRSRLPLVGSMLEKVVAAELDKKLQADARASMPLLQSCAAH
jgi:hypothetical protein